jgi:hypothetical protein
MVKLIDQIRVVREQAEADEAAETARREAQRIEGERIQRENGRISAQTEIPHITSRILGKVKNLTYVHSEPVVDNCSGAFSPYHEAYSETIIEHFKAEGLTVRLATLPIYQGGVVVAHTYTVDFSWLHA